MSRREPPGVGIDGLGYAGLVTGLAFAAKGFHVVGFDIRKDLRDELRAGRTLISERGLTELLRRQRAARRFDVVDSVQELAERTSAIFVCFPTPALSSGRIDLRKFKLGLRQLGRALRPIRSFRVVVVKSTVVPGTTDRVAKPILEAASGKGPSDLAVASNPEFLSEGSMVRDALRPARVIVGAADARAVQLLRQLYRPFRAPVLLFSPAGAELVKYASNEFLAMKVSFANETSRLAEHFGVDIDSVADAVGHDPRIGRRFLNAGPGFGGSCFEKDVRALTTLGRSIAIPIRLGEATLKVNQDQTQHAIDLVRRALGSAKNPTVAILGLAFKEGTDDVRGSRAFPLVDSLLRDGARLRLHDPAALDTFRREWIAQNRPGVSELLFTSSVSEALHGADAAVIQAAWPDYLRWPASWSRGMRNPLVIDLRRALAPKTVKSAGLNAVSLGRAGVST